MQRVIAVVVMAVLGALVAGCSSSASSGLTGKVWQWTAMTTQVPASQSVIEDPQNYTIEFKSDGTFAAKVDCNQVAGSYTTNGSNLTITPGPSTLAFCGESSKDQIYLAGLSTAASYAIAENQLKLTQSTGGTMTFK